MLKFIAHDFSYEIILNQSIEEDDVELLERLFNDKKHNWYDIRLYSLSVPPAHFLELLYLYRESNDIKLHCYSAFCSRYLYKLGFKSLLQIELRDKINFQPHADVIVIGGSAHSSQEISKILERIDIEKYIIFIVQHSDVSSDGIFDKVLKNRLEYKNIFYAEDGMRVEKSHVYIAKKDQHLKVKDGVVLLDRSEYVNFARPSISVTFDSLSLEYGSNLIAVLSCGYLDDGVDVLERMKERGVTLIVQKPSECLEASSIPEKAIENGVFDYLLSAEKIALFLQLLKSELHKDAYLQTLTKYIESFYGYSFHNYLQDVLHRRVEQFILKYSFHSFSEAVMAILFSKNAFQAFFTELSIHTSSFFRESQSLNDFYPLLQQFRKQSRIKIWSAGCSSGKEAYSTAFLLKESGLLEKSIIYATDINAQIVKVAKNALYSETTYQEMKENIKKLDFDIDVDSYIVKSDDFFKINEEIQSKVHFFVHNLVNDSSFNEFDVIECKNVLIYFNSELQEQVIELFYNSLKFGGYLILSQSEFLSDRFQNKFIKCYETSKIYKKVGS